VREGARVQDQRVGGINTRTASWLAWSLAGLSVVMFVVSVALYVLVRAAQETPSTDTLSDLLLYMIFLAFPIVGALIASRRPRNPIGWICLAAGFFWMLNAFMEGGGAYWQAAAPKPVSYLVVIDALSLWMWIPPVGLLGIYLILLFPDGRLPSRTWRPLVWLAGAVIVLASLGISLAPGPLEGHPGVRNPFGLEGHPWIGGATLVIILLLPVCILASALSLILRYRRSGGEQREQIKWIAFAASFVGMVYLSSLVTELIFAPETLTGTGSTLPLWVEVQRNLLMLSYAGVPVAVGFAVLKYRLYDIDVVINRTLVYGALTATLVVLYFGGIVVLQRVFVALTGEKSTLAVVASTLVIASLFNPLRRRIQSFIDRRFYRSKYDAAKTLEAFSAKLRDETDLDALSDDLVGVVRETMQPAHVSLWLRPDTRPKAEQAD
jgi:hypothetical protein